MHLRYQRETHERHNNDIEQNDIVLLHVAELVLALYYVHASPVDPNVMNISDNRS